MSLVGHKLGTFWHVQYTAPVAQFIATSYTLVYSVLYNIMHMCTHQDLYAFCFYIRFYYSGPNKTHPRPQNYQIYENILYIYTHILYILYIYIYIYTYIYIFNIYIYIYIIYILDRHYNKINVEGTEQGA